MAKRLAEPQTDKDLQAVLVQQAAQFSSKKIATKRRGRDKQVLLLIIKSPTS